MTRAPRFKRTTTDKVLLFTERDFDILYALYKYHVATTHQLAEIHPGSDQKTRWRLRELFDAGLVHRVNTKTDPTIPGSEPIVYALTDAGANWLSENRSDIDRFPKRYNENNARRTRATIPHSLMVAEVMLRFEQAAYYTPTRVRFLDQRTLLAHAPEKTRKRRLPTQWNSVARIEGKDIRLGNNPDQLFALIDAERPEGRNQANFFLEADRGTESVRPEGARLTKSTIYRKLLGYFATHTSKLHRAVFGETMTNFRVLWVVDSSARDRKGRTRIENIIATANEVTGGTIADLFLFTTYSAFKSGNPFTHPWVNAKGERRQLVE